MVYDLERILSLYESILGLIRGKDETTESYKERIKTHLIRHGNWTAFDSLLISVKGEIDERSFGIMWLKNNRKPLKSK